MTTPINLTHLRERIDKTIRQTTTTAGPIRVALSVAEARALIDTAEAAIEVVNREARSEYSSIYAAPSEFAAILRETLNHYTTTP
jgi:hypothetical protein